MQLQTKTLSNKQDQANLLIWENNLSIIRSQFNSGYFFKSNSMRWIDIVTFFSNLKLKMYEISPGISSVTRTVAICNHPQYL